VDDLASLPVDPLKLDTPKVTPLVNIPKSGTKVSELKEKFSKANTPKSVSPKGTPTLQAPTFVEDPKGKEPALAVTLMVPKPLMGPSVESPVIDPLNQPLVPLSTFTTSTTLPPNAGHPPYKKKPSSKQVDLDLMCTQI